MISIYSIAQSFIEVVSAKVLQIREVWSISLSLRAPFINSNCWFWEHPKHSKIATKIGGWKTKKNLKESRTLRQKTKRLKLKKKD